MKSPRSLVLHLLGAARGGGQQRAAATAAAAIGDEEAPWQPKRNKLTKSPRRRCYTGRKQRFVYGTLLESNTLVKGIIKFDLHAEPETGKTQLEVGGNVKGIFRLGPGRYGSEAIFVPRQPGISSEEDDGYLIFFVLDENTGKSEINVINAKTMSADPVAVVELPSRVPIGFHAFFVTEEQLKEQEKL